MLKIGVLGAGHLGKIHLQVLKNIPQYHIVGFYDPDPQKALEAEAKFGLKSYSDIDKLMDDADVVDIVTPTLSHYQCALQAIAKHKHFFIEKPITHTVEEARELYQKCKNTGLKVQVGHVERFNPAFIAAQQFNLKPLFIEGHRLAEFKPRGTDVSVVLDLMIHDIDIILSLIPFPVTQVSASGVALISDKIDIANARIEFANGSVANLTASRMSLKTERKLRIFQRNRYITIDFFKKEVNAFGLRELNNNETPQSDFVIDTGPDKNRLEITYTAPKVEDTNAIEQELKLFAESILQNKPTVVSLEDGLRSLELAGQILQEIENMVNKTSKAW